MATTVTHVRNWRGHVLSSHSAISLQLIMSFADSAEEQGVVDCLPCMTSLAHTTHMTAARHACLWRCDDAGHLG